MVPRSFAGMSVCLDDVWCRKCIHKCLDLWHGKNTAVQVFQQRVCIQAIGENVNKHVSASNKRQISPCQLKMNKNSTEHELKTANTHVTPIQSTEGYSERVGYSVHGGIFSTLEDIQYMEGLQYTETKEIVDRYTHYRQPIPKSSTYRFTYKITFSSIVRFQNIF